MSKNLSDRILNMNFMKKDVLNKMESTKSLEEDW